MSTKTIILITGANTGIGYESVKALLASPTTYTIIVGGRSPEKVKTAISTLEKEFPDTESELVPLQVDLTDDESIANAYKEVEGKFGRLDVLVNNAGGQFDQLIEQDPTPSTIRTAFNKAYDLNVSGTHVLTHTFVPLLLHSSLPRLLFLTSGLSSLTTAATGSTTLAAKNPFPPAGWPKPAGPVIVGYRSSKAALNMLMLDWRRVLTNDGVRVWGLSPGFLATGLMKEGPEGMKGFGAGDASLGGGFVRDVVEGKRDADVGKVISRQGVQDW